MIDARCPVGCRCSRKHTYFHVGGAENNVERAGPLLEKMGSNIFHAGIMEPVKCKV
ncbi:MAG: hypothetical protein CM1200mP12_23200 [Gammaproteobacteria bacterium]|nr:MAG: hypothetical protein CM1200mP12_23200 [Gammaproteobacteria bacterium]